MIARIRKAHGVNGELACQSFTQDDRRFKKLKRVFLRNAKGEISERQVLSARVTANGPLLTLEGVQDRDSAQALSGQEVLIPISERPKLPEGRAYYDEIIGMTVIDDATNQPIGTVTDVLEMPAGEVFVLDLNGTEHLMSSAGEELVSLSASKREVRVCLLEQY